VFDGFTAETIDVGDTTVFVRRAGQGPPLLLLHGFPETHVMWRHVAPTLTDAFTVVCADLRGYGASGAPPSADDHAPYAKRAMANDLVRAMARLGFAEFAVVGHDRGARVAYRLALDHPTRVARLALLDVVPTSVAFERADARLALSFWPWALLAQPAPLPERLILGAPDAVIDDAATQWGTDPASFDADVRAAYVEALRDPAHVHAICEEYRAAATLDVAHDAADRDAGRRIACPVLVLWAARAALDAWYGDAGGPLGIWRQWADDVSGRAMPGGHFFPEQEPAETAAALRAFFAR
jgi:haloacetate dehalogenase